MRILPKNLSTPVAGKGYNYQSQYYHHIIEIYFLSQHYDESKYGKSYTFTFYKDGNYVDIIIDIEDWNEYVKTGRMKMI